MSRSRGKMTKWIKRATLSFLLGTAFILPVHAVAAAQSEEPDPRLIDLSADQLTYDQKEGLVIASGNVVMIHEGYRLEAATVRYNEKTGIVDADGGVRVTDPEGNILAAENIRLDDTLSEGFVDNVQLILSDGSMVAARDGERKIGRITVFHFAVWSPCEICHTEGKDDDPLWQIKAQRVTHDQEKKRLYYKNAYLEFLGVPVFYLPYISHPDPSVERASGFLAPDLKQSTELGLSFHAPYHHVFSPSSDVTITPIITTKEGPVLSTGYRQHVGFGQFKADGSITYVDKRGLNNEQTGGHEFRGHFFSDGLFRHGDGWRSNYQIQLTSDDTYLRRYDFSNLDTLTNEYVLDKFFGRSYFSAQGLQFEGLRIEDVSGLNAIALPLLNLNYVSKPLKNGSVFRVNSNGLALLRTKGQDTQRLSLSGSWELPYTNQLGQIFRVSAKLRGDVYHVSDADRPDNQVFAGENGSTGRFLPSLTGSFRWPFVRSGKNIQQTIEPIITVVATRDDGNKEAIPNEDSRAFELTDVNIFSENRSSGLDRFDSGSRVAYGMRWALSMDKIDTEVIFGQSYRFAGEDTAFPDGSGLSDNVSDFVGRFSVAYGRYFDITNRIRLDKDDLAIRRNEVNATLGPERFRVTAGYFRLNRDNPLELLENREEIRAGARFRITGNWTLTGNVTQNLTNGADPIAYGAGIGYEDECFDVFFSFRKSFTEDRDIVPGRSFGLRVRLKHLG